MIAWGLGSARARVADTPPERAVLHGPAPLAAAELALNSADDVRQPPTAAAGGDKDGGFFTMNLLAFDTATEQMSVALRMGDEVLSVDGAGGAQASATLIPTVMGLLARAGVRLGDLDAIAFGRGPGAFTGLRTACAVAQGLAFGAGKPVLPIDTLLGVAESARAGLARPAHEFPVWALLDARMDQIYAARYRHRPGSGWQVLDAPMLTDAAALGRRWQAEPPRALAGAALTAFAGRLATGDARLYPAAAPTAASLLPLAEALWHAGGAVDPALALPLYLRDKVAQTTLEREDARAAQSTAGVAR